MMNKAIIPKLLGLVVVVMIMICPLSVVARQLDYVYGSLPGRIIERQLVPDDYVFKDGEYFGIVYRIAVKKWFLEGEDVVIDRIKEHLNKIIEEFREKRPDAEIVYAKFDFLRIDDKVLWQEYVYDVEVIGKVNTKLSGNVNETKLVGPVAVAIIVALIVAAIIATIILVNQPAVEKLLISTSEAIQSIASNPLLLALGFGALSLFLLVIVLVLSKK